MILLKHILKWYNGNEQITSSQNVRDFASEIISSDKVDIGIRMVSILFTTIERWSALSAENEADKNEVT